MKLQIVLFFVFFLEYINATCDQGVYELGVSKKEQDEIVKLHNDHRLEIAQGKLAGQPRGVNLKRMTWDDNLAKAAQNIANSCIFAHQPVHDDRWSVGQNLYTSASTGFSKGADWKTATDTWWDENKVYKFGKGFPDSVTHYTQMAWADTVKVGCGYTFFPVNDRFKYKKLYACNYGPTGNVQGVDPYKKGTSGCENLC